jgi:hypothetical protein
MDNVLDVALEADKLLEIAAKKLRKTESKVVSNLRFVRAFVQKDKVTVECEDAKTGRAKFFAARLFVDATGTNSPVSRQLNAGRSITHVCPTVGTVGATNTRRIFFSTTRSIREPTNPCFACSRSISKNCPITRRKTALGKWSNPFTVIFRAFIIRAGIIKRKQPATAFCWSATPPVYRVH